MITGAPHCALRGARRPDMLLDDSQLKELGNAAKARHGPEIVLHSLLIYRSERAEKGT
jgi:hypothetical protein